MTAMLCVAMLLLAVVPAQAGTMLLRWGVRSGSAQDYFAVFRNRPSRDNTYRQIGTSTTLSYRDTTARDGARYCYKVRAVNSAGVSSFSNVACGIVARGRTTRITLQ